MLILHYLTSINSYSFGFLVFLFIISFKITKKQIKSIIIFRVILGILVFIFYFFGWESFGHHKNIPHKGEKITFSKTQMIQICNLSEVKKFFNITSPLLAYRYDCDIFDSSNSFINYEITKFKEIGKMKEIPKNKEFTIVDYVYLKTHGILLNSFAGPSIDFYILLDNENQTYITMEANIK